MSTMRVKRGIGRQADLWKPPAGKHVLPPARDRLPGEARRGDLAYIENGPPNGRTTGWYLVTGRKGPRIFVRPPGGFDEARSETSVP